MNIEPGTRLMVIVNVDTTEEMIHALDSVLHQVKGTTMIIGQTDPPLPVSMLNREVTVTFLSTGRNGPARYGFRAVIKEFIDHYRAGTADRIEAVSMVQCTEPLIYNIRRFYRVQPTGRSGLRMTIEGHGVNVIDISLGGAKVSHYAPLTLLAGTMVHLSLDIDGRKYPLDAKIIAASADTDTARGLSFASAQFLNVGKTLEDVLSKKIRDIERETELWAKK
jgi:hypothetical protein